MFAASTVPTRRSVLAASVVAAASALVLLAAGGQALPSAEPQGPAAREGHAAYAPNPAQPPAKIIADPPKPELLAEGVVIVPFRTENVQIVPVFGPAAAKVSPRIGHLHVTLDDATWHWAHTSNDPVIVAPLPPGPHKILLELADADHNVLAKEVVKFEVPRR
jgi:hypothetical protein